MSNPGSSAFFGSTRNTNGCIMVAEDNPSIRTGVVRLLEKSGYDVIEVENGEQAIQTIGEGENPLVVDVIITDIDNPKGMEAISFFKKEHPRVSIIALTGLEDPQGSKQEKTRVIILGAGKGGSAFLDLLSHLPGIEIVGIADKVSSAPGLRRARELGIPVWDDIENLIAQEGVNLIIDVTGDPGMVQSIWKNKREGVEMLGGAASRLLWNVVQYEGQMQGHLVQTEKLSNLMKAGVIFDYLVKPLDEDKTKTTVTQAMERREIAKL